MKALTIVSITALTIDNMCKAVDKGIQIINIRLLQILQKIGGQNGSYMRQAK